MATKQKQKIIALDFPIITTILGEALDRWQYEIKQKDTKCALGFKEERTVHIMAEESVYLKNKKIKLLSIDRLLEGEPPVSSTHTHTHCNAKLKIEFQAYHHHHKHAITIPPVRNSRT